MAFQSPCRIFGFLSLDQPLVASVRDDLTSLLFDHSNTAANGSNQSQAEAASDIWLTIPRQGHVCRPVHVLRYPFRQRKQVHHQDALAFKQHAIWYAPHRNRQVASLAKRIATRQRLTAALEEALAGVTAPPLVVVESLDHAAALQLQALRKWPVLCLEGCNMAGLPPKTKLHPIPRKPHLLQAPAIATFTALPYLEQLGVIVRADGWIGELPLGVEPLSCSLDNPQPLVVIDLADKTAPRLRRNARRREQTYRRKNWSVENLRPQQG